MMPEPFPIIYLTGAPASGKTTIAREIVELLRQRSVITLWLDGDDLRRVLTPKPTYTAEERDWFYDALANLALLASRSGVTVVISATASKREYRDRIRLESTAFIEVYLACPAEVRRTRDPKGLYRRAEGGVVRNLPGADAAYEPPVAPAIEIDTSKGSPSEAARAVLALIDARSLDGRVKRSALKHGERYRPVTAASRPGSRDSEQRRMRLALSLQETSIMKKPSVRTAHVYEKEPRKFESCVNDALDRLIDEGAVIDEILYSVDPSTGSNRMGGFGALIVYEKATERPDQSLSERESME